MTDRATARHRAPRRASTPLSTLSTGITLAVGDRIEALGRGGAVIAVSSGLVASMALPASALPASALPASALPGQTSPPGQTVDDGAATASIPLPAPVAPDTAELGATGQLRASTASLQFDVGSPPAATLQPAAAPALPAAAPAVPVQAAAVTALTARPAVAAAPAAKAARVATTAPARGSAVIALASRYVGVGYRYGGSNPSGFDCSGYVQYVYRHLGLKLPRTADQQLHAVRRVSRSQARPGDLLFFVYGGYSSHVAIYAGNGMMYDSPHRGARVAKRKIYSASVVFGRVVN